MTSNVAEPGPKGRGIKRLAILGLLVLSLLNGLIGLADLYDGVPVHVATYALRILLFCIGLYVLMRAKGMPFDRTIILRALLLMAIGFLILHLRLWTLVEGWGAYAKGILGIEFVWVLSSFTRVICYAGSLFLVLAGTFNIIPEKPFIFIVRLVLIALAVGFAGNVPAHFILLLLQVLPGQYQPALFFFDGLITALAYSFAYYFVIMGFVGETRPLWGSKGVGDGPGGQGR